MDFLINKLKGWRTVIVNVILSIIPILQLTEFRDIIPPAWVPWYALGIVLLNMYMRTITTTKIGTGA